MARQRELSISCRSIQGACVLFSIYFCVLARNSLDVHAGKAEAAAAAMHYSAETKKAWQGVPDFSRFFLPRERLCPRGRVLVRTEDFVFPKP